MRPSGRAPDALRPVSLETGVNRYAEGSCLVAFGHTRVLVTASAEDGVPGFLKGRGQGWVTAEYGMLPRSTHTRSRREAAQGKQSGRTQEIQRLIGRSMRAVVDLKALGERQVILDCDVIQADGGTRTAAITGAWVALRLATRLHRANELSDCWLPQLLITLGMELGADALPEGIAVLEIDHGASDLDGSTGDADAPTLLHQVG